MGRGVQFEELTREAPTLKLLLLSIHDTVTSPTARVSVPIALVTVFGRFLVRIPAGILVILTRSFWGFPPSFPRPQLQPFRSSEFILYPHTVHSVGAKRW
jgi:hypothetical protein